MKHKEHNFETPVISFATGSFCVVQVFILCRSLLIILAGPPNNTRKYALTNILAGELPYVFAKWPDERTTT